MDLDQQTTKKVAITHLSREYEPNHTSWAEIIAFDEILNQYYNVQTEINDWRHLNKNLNIYSQIYIFATGSLNEMFKNQLESFNGQIYLIIQDPNWSVNFNIDRSYHLVTPFKKWNHTTKYEIISDIQLLNINISNFDKHYYIPFGLMCYYNLNYWQKYINEKQNMPLDIFNKKYIYAGSLKKDRLQEFNYAINHYDVAFYGNFSSDELKHRLGVDSLLNSVCKGKVSPYLIPHLYGKHGTPILMPDYLMLYLNVSYIRYFELFLSQALYSTNALLLTCNETNEQLAMSILNNFATFNNDLFNINIDQLVDYFEDNQTLLNRIDNLLEEN